MCILSSSDLCGHSLFWNNFIYDVKNRYKKKEKEILEKIICLEVQI